MSNQNQSGITLFKKIPIDKTICVITDGPCTNSWNILIRQIYEAYVINLSNIVSKKCSLVDLWFTFQGCQLTIPGNLQIPDVWFNKISKYNSHELSIICYTIIYYSGNWVIYPEQSWWYFHYYLQLDHSI